MNKKYVRLIITLFIALGYYLYANDEKEIVENNNKTEEVKSYDLSTIPEYSGEDYVILNNNIPDLSDLSHSGVSFEVYSELDSLESAKKEFINNSNQTNNTIDNESNNNVDIKTKYGKSINSVKPTGWHTIKYDIVDGKYLYNRCHLIGFQLTGENDNKNNLITCTRHMNTQGMLPFENKVSEYIKKTSNHVLYRVTPIYEGTNLLANGVVMEAESIEDNGEGIRFNVFVYNVEPGIYIDYKTGESRLLE